MPLNVFYGINFSSIIVDSRGLDVRWKMITRISGVNECGTLFSRHDMTQPLCSFTVRATSSSIFSLIIMRGGKSIIILVPWVAVLSSIGAWGAWGEKRESPLDALLCPEVFLKLLSSWE